MPEYLESGQIVYHKLTHEKWIVANEVPPTVMVGAGTRHTDKYKCQNEKYEDKIFERGLLLTEQEAKEQGLIE